MFVYCVFFEPVQFEGILNFYSEVWQATKRALELEVENNFTLNRKSERAAPTATTQEAASNRAAR